MPANAIIQRSSPVIVLIQAIDLRVIQALRYARNLTTDIIAFNVTASEDDAAALHARWNTMNTCVPLVTRISHDGGFAKPLLEFIKSSEYGTKSEDMVTVILPQIVTSKRWQRLQQYSVSKYLENKLSRHPQVVFVVLPIHLPDADHFQGNVGPTVKEDDRI